MDSPERPPGQPIGCARQISVYGDSSGNAGGGSDLAGAGGSEATGTMTSSGASGAIGGALNGLRWELPCTGPRANDYSCSTIPNVVTTWAVVTGPAGKTYEVTLRFRGVVEERAYDGGAREGHWYVGGNSPDVSDPNNIYALTVSSPSQTYYVNAGTPDIRYCDSIDFVETIPIDAGATVTLTANAVDAAQLLNEDSNGAPLVVPGIAPAPNAYNGQFVQMDVESVQAK